MFEFYWRGRKNHIRRISWTEPSQWCELPRVGDSIKGLSVPRPTDPVVLEVSWITDGSARIRLNDVIEDATPEESRFLPKVPEGVAVSTPKHDPLENNDKVIQRVVWLLNLVEHVTPYELLNRFLLPRSWRSGSYAWFYVFGWLIVLALVLAFSPDWGGWPAWLFVAVIPAVRVFDLLRWNADLLLDRAHNNLVSSERSLSLVFLNLIEVSLIGAIWLSAAGQPEGAGSALYDSFLLVTQLANPHVAGLWIQLGMVAVEVVSLVLLAGGVALLVAEVGEKLRVTGEWQGARK
jgi:hypothetical protein